MTAARQPEFPEYGSGGDYAGARRSRRAFRYAVAATLVFTAVLWLAEQYLRYDETERLYLVALTREPESARILLRQAMKIDAATAERPTAKYAAALAEREEEERRLRAYEDAYELDPENAFLAMRFGCELFKHGEMRRAHTLFRAAYEHDPQNALPLYLEAATLPFIEEGNFHFEETFQLLERANVSGLPVEFQRPLWFSTLPQRSEWYARWRRQAVQDVLAPIQTFTAKLVELVEADLENDYAGVWGTRLEAIEAMGWRITHDSQPEVGAPQAILGMTIQLQAIQLRRQIYALEEQNVADLAAKESKLEAALGVINQFEYAREEDVAAQKTALRIPLELVGKSFVLLLILYLVVYTASRIVHAGRQSWTLRHSVWARAIIMGGCLILLLLLALASTLGFRAYVNTAALNAVAYVWFAVVGAMAAAGAFYPAFLLPLAHQVVRDRTSDKEESERLLAWARRARRIAYVSLMRRYYGILTGSVGMVVCIWVLGFRIALGLYPWQTKLLAPGLGEFELEAVRRALSILTGS